MIYVKLNPTFHLHYFIALVLVKPYSNPQKTNVKTPSDTPKESDGFRIVGPRYDPKAPGSLVMPRPSASHQVPYFIQTHLFKHIINASDLFVLILLDSNHSLYSVRCSDRDVTAEKERERFMTIFVFLKLSLDSGKTIRSKCLWWMWWLIHISQTF